MNKLAFLLTSLSLLITACASKSSAPAAPVSEQCSCLAPASSSVAADIIRTGAYRLTFEYQAGFVGVGDRSGVLVTIDVDRAHGRYQTTKFQTIAGEDVPHEVCAYFHGDEVSKIEHLLIGSTIEISNLGIADNPRARVTISDGQRKAELNLLTGGFNELVLSNGSSIANLAFNGGLCPTL